jgi:hypothetical protein
MRWLLHTLFIIGTILIFCSSIFISKYILPSIQQVYAGTTGDANVNNVRFKILGQLRFILLNIRESTVSSMLLQPTSPHLISTPTHTIIPSPFPSIVPTNVPIIPSPRITALDDLNTAVNTFRNMHEVSQLRLDSSLCVIAQSRLEELHARNDLDHHEGFQKYFDMQSLFNRMGETIYQSSDFQSNTSIVENGWANSSGHRQTLLDSTFRFGCGARDAHFAVFIIAAQ